MLKTGRFRERESQLEKALNPKKMESLWKKHVRSSLRNQALSDLHDYYDFHIHIKNRIQSVKSLVLTGIYQPSRPIRVRSEKQLGMSRHIVILTPQDALVLETIADFLMPIIKKAQPCKCSYFSRNQSQPKTPANIDETFGYPWWILWPQFQKRILQFTEEKEYTVTTDVATYYDNIGFTKLRNFLSNLGVLSEIFLDFMFFLFERFVWRPDYLPFPGKGLPQIDLDAPRLVAHAFLFEVDRFLSQETDEHFVRWLDDVDFGCDSIIEAKTLLRNIDELLLSRGLHLNSSKTKILSKKEAIEHFQLRENRFLNIFHKRVKRLISENKSISKEKKILRKRFHKFNNANRVGQWIKIFKRYISLSRICNDNFLQSITPEYLSNHAALRSSIFLYYKSLGWSDKREKHIISYVNESLDDIGFSEAIDVLITWICPETIRYIQRMRELALLIADSEESVRYIGALKLLAKYGNGKNIDFIVNKYTHLWKNNDWVARQVASIYPRISNEDIKETVKNVIYSFGLTSAKSVIDNLELISNQS